MNTHRIIILLLSIFMLGACSTKSKTVQHPPEPLTEVPEQIRWQESDAIDVGKGDGDFYLQLQPAFVNTSEGTLIYTADYKGNVIGMMMDDDIHRLWRVRPKDLAVTGGVGAGSGVVLVGTHKGEVLALSRSEGEALWRTYLSSEILSPPQSAQGVVVVLTEDSRVYGLDAESGEIIWKYEHNAPLLQLRGSAPVIIEHNTVYVGFANGYVCALSLQNGGLLWQQAVSYPRGRSEIDRVIDVNGKMAIHDNILYVVNYQGRVIALDVRSRRVLWEKEFSSYAGLSTNDDAVFITDEESKVWALDRHTGDTLWQQANLLNRELTAPTVYEGIVVVGDYEGYIHALSINNGQILGRTQVDNDPIHTPPVTVGDYLFVLSSNGELVRYAPIRVS